MQRGDDDRSAVTGPTSTKGRTGIGNSKVLHVVDTAVFGDGVVMVVADAIIVIFLSSFFDY